MSAESVRAFLASVAPDLEIVELPASSQTHTLSAAWGIRAAQIAKTLALRRGRPRGAGGRVRRRAARQQESQGGARRESHDARTRGSRDNHGTRARGRVPVWPRHAHADLL